MQGQEVKGMALAKVKSVEEFVPKPSPTTISNANKIGEAEYKIIEDCLQLDGTVEQACMLAGISVPSYYKHREKNPDFARRMDIARQMPKMIARAAIQRRIRQGDAKTALDYLKLRDKRYGETPREEEGTGGSKMPTVQFISVASNEGANNTTNPDSQTPTKQNSYSEGYSSSGEVEKMTPRENEEQVLRNIDLSSFSNE